MKVLWILLKRTTICLALTTTAMHTAQGTQAAPTVNTSKMALVTLETAVEMDAPPTRVWEKLVDASKAPSWCPLWREPTAPSGSLDQVGNTLAYRDKYGNTGRSVVVFAAPKKELRIAHVPDNGSYLCQITLRLESTGAKTRLVAREQYSDQLDVPIDRDTAASSLEDLVATVAALKKVVESK